MPIDPNLIPLIEGIVNEEGLSISETVNRLLSFAISDHHITNGNLLRWDSLMPRPQDAPGFQVQQTLIQQLAKVQGRSLASAVPDLITFLRHQVEDLKTPVFPLPQLLVSQRLSRAARQLAVIGKPRWPG
ncbi:MAG: hypothetical protein IT327_03490 [Anaerolineae bacterium]|nr:hypothetical protein [Anaerolineae bacterium]